MKKLLFVLMGIVALNCTSLAQNKESKFPYEKMLHMTHQELLDAKFKYDGQMNRYVLNKRNGLYITLAILNAGDNYIPDVNDYRVVIQNSTDGPAYITVTFYDDRIYHQTLTFGMDNGSDMLETESGKVKKNQFRYADYNFDLTYQIVGQSASYTNYNYNYNYKVSRDESYNIYSFTINTGRQPQSQWLDKEATKQVKRDAAGRKKKSASDLM